MTKYTGGCHCGAVKFEAEASLDNVISCNCSICTKRGSILAFIPETQFKFLTPEAPLTDYQFNKHVIHHLFCPTCGILSFAKAKAPDGTPTVALNVRCLDGVDLEKLKITPFNGRDL